MCDRDAEGGKSDCHSCMCPQSDSPGHAPVTQDVVISGKVVTVRMCSRCGTGL